MLGRSVHYKRKLSKLLKPLFKDNPRILEMIRSHHVTVSTRSNNQDEKSAMHVSTLASVTQYTSKLPNNFPRMAEHVTKNNRQVPVV